MRSGSHFHIQVGEEPRLALRAPANWGKCVPWYEDLHVSNVKHRRNIQRDSKNAASSSVCDVMKGSHNAAWSEMMCNVSCHSEQGVEKIAHVCGSNALRVFIVVTTCGWPVLRVVRVICKVHSECWIDALCRTSLGKPV